jgi:lipid-A-disaccharide synthase
MPNLILSRAAVPELLQADCTPERLADALATLIEGGAGAAQKRDLGEIRDRLGLDQMQKDGIKPSDRAAKFVLDTVRHRRTQT